MCIRDRAYGGGFLWIFDALAPKGAEVLRVSETTGVVLSRIPMPQMSRVLLAADDEGLWVARSQESGWNGAQPGPLYFVGVHATHPIVVPTSPSPSGEDYLEWLTAAGHTAWADVVSGGMTGVNRFETFKSPTSISRSVNAPAKNEPSDIGEGHADAPPVIDVPGVGLVAALPGWLGSVSNGSTTQELVTLDPATGRQHHLVTLHTEGGTLEANLYYGGAFYVLVHYSGSLPADLYRVQL